MTIAVYFLQAGIDFSCGGLHRTHTGLKLPQHPSHKTDYVAPLYQLFFHAQLRPHAIDHLYLCNSDRASTANSSGKSTRAYVLHTLALSVCFTIHNKPVIQNSYSKHRHRLSGLLIWSSPPTNSLLPDNKLASSIGTML